MIGLGGLNGRSKSPMHQRIPAYELGTLPSSAKRWFKSIIVRSASCGVRVHFKIAFPQVIRTLLDGRPSYLSFACARSAMNVNLFKEGRIRQFGYELRVDFMIYRNSSELLFKFMRP